MTKPQSTKGNNTEEKLNSQSELHTILWLAMGLLLAFFMWAPEALTGVVGDFLSKTAYGLFGTLAALLPVLFVYLAAESYWQRTQETTGKRKIYLLVIIYLTSLLISLLTLQPERVALLAKTDGRESAWQAVKCLWLSGENPDLVSESSFWTGGLVGGLSALSLRRVIGFSGSLIVTISMLLAMAILTFGVSWKSTLLKMGQAVSLSGRKLKDGWQIFKSKQETRRAQKAIASGEETVLEDKKPKTEFDNNEQDAAEASFSFQFPVGDWLQEDTKPAVENLPADDFGEPVIEPSSSSLDFSPALASERSYEPKTQPLSLGWDNDFGELEPTKEPVIRSAYIEHKTIYYPSQTVQNAVPASNQPLQSTELMDDNTLSSSSTLSSEDKDKLADIAARISEGEDALEDLAGREDWEDRSASSNKALPKAKIKKGQLSFFGDYLPPPTDILIADDRKSKDSDKEEIRLLGAKLEQTLNDFGVDAKVVNFITGPTISRFEVKPGPGVKVSKIVNLADDIALSLAATSIRIEAPIPGKSAVGIEIPNKKTQAVRLRDLIESDNYAHENQGLMSALGRNIQGEPLLCDLSAMPHLLIAGATGSGKSVCINSILISLLYKVSPKDLRMVMIDPKVVELSVYNGIPHLAAPVVTDPKKACGVLDWAVTEMERRYMLFADNAVRDFKAYNQLVAQDQVEGGEHLPYILIVIDELSDLMLTSPKEIEDAIARLTAMARAAGIHLIIATQRPSVDVITGVIKANIPSRISFAVASQVDSRTILDMAGAEKLLGKGDMLYYPQNASKPLRGQGAFVTDHEVERVVSYLKSNYQKDYNEDLERQLELAGSATSNGAGTAAAGSTDEEDELLYDALQTVMDNEYASVSLLQRRLNVGYPRAARLVDTMHERGWIGPFEGSKPRKVLLTAEEGKEIIELNS